MSNVSTPLFSTAKLIKTTPPEKKMLRTLFGFVCITAISYLMMLYPVPVSLELPITSIWKSETSEKCAGGQVFNPKTKQCLPLAKLHDICTLTTQCTVPNSFCGYVITERSMPDVSLVCQCLDGYSATSTGTCVPIRSCSHATFNSAMIRFDCTDENAFCRHNRCICRPDFELNPDTGECIPELYRPNIPLAKYLYNEGKEAATSADEKNFAKMLNMETEIINSKFAKYDKTMTTVQYVILLGLLLNIIIMTTLICMRFSRRTFVRKMKPEKQYQTVPLREGNGSVTEESEVVSNQQLNAPPPYETI